MSDSESNAVSHVYESMPAERELLKGARGGQYYLTAKGKKVYVNSVPKAPKAPRAKVFGFSRNQVARRVLTDEDLEEVYEEEE